MNASDIRDTREQLGLNQVEFAQLSGVHPITVSKWERDEAAPSAYQSAIFEQFRKAARNPKVRKSIKGILVSAGVALALATLLKHLVRK
jgi:DNA-binding XRE family transcriptional regulator